MPARTGYETSHGVRSRVTFANTPQGQISLWQTGNRFSIELAGSVVWGDIASESRARDTFEQTVERAQ